MDDRKQGFQPSTLLYFLAFSTAAACLLLSIPNAMRAQTLVSNNTFLDSSVNHAIKVYTETIGGSARLYNGSQYKDYELHDYDTGHPYFYSDDWTIGSIHYDGQYSTNVYLLYNLTLEKVIIENPFDNSKIELIKDKIARFSMAGHDFVKLSADSSSQSAVRSGFYDVLYDGRVKVYAKRSKEIVQKIESGLEKKKFIERNKYFIYKNGSYFPVKSKSSVLRVFNDRKTGLKKQLVKNKMVFKENREFSISRLARFYDESENTP